MWDGVDRRKFVRAEYPCLITVRKSEQPQEAILTHTEDISVGGVRAIIRRKLQMLIEVELRIDLKDMLPPIVFLGQVCRVKELPSAQQNKAPRYETGIRFSDLSDEDRHRIINVIKHVKGG